VTQAQTAALQMIDVLREYGVDRVFGIPGGAISGLYAALLQRTDVQHVTAKHESGAAFMAMGYAMATGRPGVVFTTAGPGITNALTGLASAYYEGVPVVLIAGEVSRSAFGRGALQESAATGLDATALTRSITKFTAQLTQPGPAASVLRKALATAYSGRRGPVFLSLPLDVAATEVPVQPISGGVRSSFEVDSAGCRTAMEQLSRASRPLIIAGSGMRDRSSRRVLRRLAENVGAPVVVSTKAKGVFPEDHPLYLGIFGFGGHESVSDYLRDGVDVLLVCGAGLNDFSTNAWSPLLKGERAFIQIDIDAARIGRNYPVTLGLLGPGDAVIGRMLEHAPDSRTPRGAPTAGMRVEPYATAASGALSTIDVVRAMNVHCPGDAVYTADMGEHLAVALHYLRVGEAADFITCLGLGSMGSGICSAIGYQMGVGSRRTYAICGDGGFLMFGSEFATAVQHDVPVTFVIINDSRLNMVHHGMRDLYGSTPDFSTQLIDFARLAQSMGGEGIVIRTHDELNDALRAIPTRARVLDVRVDPEVRLMGSQRNAALRQFKEGPNGK